MSVILKKGSTTIKFPPEEVEKLKTCSKFIEGNLEFMDQDGEDKEFEITADDFDEAQLKDAIDYLRNLDYKPQLYRKIMGNDINAELNTAYEKTLALKYKKTTDIKKLLLCAKYLQIKPLITYALVLLGVELKVDENKASALKEISDKWNITAQYDMEVERSLKEQYAFLRGDGQ